MLGVALVRKKGSEDLEVDAENPYIIEFHDLFSDESKEDSYTAYSALHAFLLLQSSRLKQYKRFKIYTDGAGCFSSNLFQYYLAHEYLSTFMCTEHTLSEAGEGKTILDAHFSFLSTYISNSVLSGKGRCDVIDAATAAEAVCTGKGIHQTSSYKFEVDRSHEIK